MCVTIRLLMCANVCACVCEQNRIRNGVGGGRGQSFVCVSNFFLAYSLHAKQSFFEKFKLLRAVSQRKFKFNRHISHKETDKKKVSKGGHMLDKAVESRPLWFEADLLAVSVGSLTPMQ